MNKRRYVWGMIGSGSGSIKSIEFKKLSFFFTFLMEFVILLLM